MRETVIVTLLIVSLCGCAVNEPFVPLEEEPYIKNLKIGKPTALTASFAPPTIDFDAAALNKEAEGWFAMRPSGKWLGRLLRSAIERVKLFSRSVSADTKTVEEAWASGADLLIIPKLKKYRVYYGGTNRLFVPNIIAWLFLLVPSWFIKDEVYGVEGELEFSFISTHSGKRLFSRYAGFKTERSLDDFERGWQLLGIFRVPKSLSEPNWKKVEEVLRKQIEKEILLAVVKLMNEDVRAELLSPHCRKKMAKRCGLILGLSRYAARGLPRLKFAADDAIAFRRLLLRSTDQPSAERNIKILTNDTATKDAVTKALESLLQRLQPEDEVFFYFAGYGTQMIRTIREKPFPKSGSDSSTSKKPNEKGKPESDERRLAEPALLLFDSDPKREKSLLPLLELLSLFRKSPARRVVLVLDTGFGTEKTLRSVESSLEGAEPIKEHLSQIIEEEPFILISASDFSASEGDAEFEHQKHSVFTFYILHALTGKADVDKNGIITLKEVFKFVYPRVVEETQMEACAQHPVMLGKGAETIILKRNR